MKKVNKKLSLNKNVVSTLQDVKGGNAAMSTDCPTVAPGATCPQCGGNLTTVSGQVGTAIGCNSGHWYC